MWIGIGTAIAFVGLFVFLSRSGVTGFGSGDSSEKELFRLCRGDREMVERLIALEIDRGRNKNRNAAIRTAISSLKRDNQ